MIWPTVTSSTTKDRQDKTSGNHIM